MAAGAILATYICGVQYHGRNAGLLATVLFAARLGFGLGKGGIERVAAYTTASCQVVAGVMLPGVSHS